MSKVLSHSEIDQFLTCERKHFYAFGVLNHDGSQGLESRHLSDGLYRGTLGHAALEAFYKLLAERQKGATVMLTDQDMADAQDAARAVLNTEFVQQPERAELILGLMQIIEAYFGYYYDADKHGYWYVAVEMEFRTTTNYAFKPDLIRQVIKTGKYEVVDHKFLANLYGPDEIGIQPQLAKYVGWLRDLGYEVHDGLYNLINNRVLKTKPYVADSKTMRRVPLGLTEHRITRTMLENDRIAFKIRDFKEGSLEVWAHSVNRTANSFNCKNCPFLALCVADLNGEDTSVMRQYEFQPNTYGYDKEEVAS